MAADLHCHSTFSDGSLSPAQIVTLAKRLGLQGVAVTDHDTAAGAVEAAAAGHEANLKVIAGIEISAYDFKRGRKVHILGYGVQAASKLEEACLPVRISRHKAALKMVTAIAEAGYPITQEDALLHAGQNGMLYKQHIMHALMERGYAVSVYGRLYEMLFRKGGAADFASDYMDALEAVRLVIEAGGLPFLAHPFLYDSMEMLGELVDAGLRGLEICHPLHGDEDVLALLRLKEEYSLLACGGSDFHGLYGEREDCLGCRSLGDEDWESFLSALQATPCAQQAGGKYSF